ncbi:hypothetical protein [Sphingomonas sp. PP-CE-1G-424]|uniref:hypothetical protein n=1 Tax=Sphingomonas sp. PP-CE-1G-424 TaxID=2135658 RepID=UPI0010551149|nr:hypothetical protein [Sphingomonas sp. PP-CE-1G-424]TCP65362.1 hypothetical protein C8J43_11218 [Sphingomonas sp. PP-CE-1G-424]
MDVDTRAGLSIGSAVTGGRYGNVPAIDFSRPLAPKVREPSPGAGRPGGVPFDDLFEVFETGDLVFPRCVRGRGVGEVPGYGELELSVTHSYMSRYKAASTCVSYERGQRLFYSSPIVQKLKRQGALAIEGSVDQARVLIAKMLEEDLGCSLSPARNHSAFYVDPGKQGATAVARILYGMAIGISIQQALEIYPHANPFLQDHLPPSVRFAEHAALGTDRSQEELRKLLYEMPRYFIMAGDKWPSVGRLVTTPMNVAYKTALLAGWSSGHLWILRALIESGARLSEIVALTILDWMEASFGGVRCNAINKGSRGQIHKEIGWTPGCAADGIAYIDDHRISPLEMKRYGRSLKFDDYREKYEAGHLDDLRVPIVPTRIGGNYTRDGFYNHKFSPTFAPLGLRGHDPRHAFVSSNLDTIYAKYWDEPDLLAAACQKLIEYMAWSTGEAMLFLYSKRHRQRRNAILSAAFHNVMQADETAVLAPGRTALPQFCNPNPIDDAFDSWMGSAK